MSAPFKAGLDYFPHDVDMSADPRMEYVEAIHGIIGYAVYNKILEKIYHDGYYTKWADRDLVIFAKKINVDKNVCINVVNDCINEGLFHKKIYEKYRILTSAGIQKRYLRCCEKCRRKRVVLVSEFLLLELKVINSLIKEDNYIINSINDVINPQKEREREKEIEKESKGDNDDIIPYREIIFHLNQMAGKSFGETREAHKKHIRARWREGYRLDDFLYVIDIKAGQWKGTDNEKYLRPETLFGTKFEGYRNEKSISAHHKASAHLSSADDIAGDPSVDPEFKIYKREIDRAISEYQSQAEPEEMEDLQRRIYEEIVLRYIPDFEEAFTQEEKENKLARYFRDYLPGYIAKKINFPSFTQWKAGAPGNGKYKARAP